MKKIKIFLASSFELKDDREKFEQEIGRKNKAWIDKQVFLHLDIWEDSSFRMNPDGIQAGYNQLAREADLFVLLAYTKVGPFTADEFEHAFGAFKAGKKPFIFTYFRKPGTNKCDPSLLAFHAKLDSLGHFSLEYERFYQLWNAFNKELDRFFLNDFTAFDFSPGKSVGQRTINQGSGSIYIEKSDGPINIG